MTLIGKPRGEYAKTARRREELLQAGMEVFSENGYRSGSIREIADRVGLSQAGLLHHFSNKHELLAAVLARRDEISNEMIRVESPDGPQVLTGIEMLRAIAQIFASNASTRGLVSLFTMLSAEATASDHVAHDYFLQRYATIRSQIEQAFREVEADGLLRPDVDPARAARMVVAVMDGLQVQWLLDEEAVDMAADLSAYIQSLLVAEL
jgi:AcrR family transcriptional regulator